MFILMLTNSVIAFSMHDDKSEGEIKQEIVKLRSELESQSKNEYVGASENISFRMMTKSELQLMPLKNELAELEYELAKKEGRTIDLNYLLNRSGSNRIEKQTRRGSDINLETGDVLLFYSEDKGIFSSVMQANFGIFHAVAKGYLHAIVVLDDGKNGIDAWHDNNSRIQPLQDMVNQLSYTRVVVKRFNLSKQEKDELNRRARWTFYDKPYPNVFAIGLGIHKKDDYTKLYCSQIAWGLYKLTKNIDIDGDGGWIVFPVDILNSIYGTSFIAYAS